MSIQQATVLAANSLGIAPQGFDGSFGAIGALDPNDQIALTAAVGAYIRANQSEFTAGQIATANSMAGMSGQPLADAGFSVSDFLSDTASNAETLVGQPLVNLGNAASAVANAVPLIAVAVGLFILVSWTKKTAAAA